MQQQNDSIHRGANAGVAIQLALSYALAGGVTLALFAWLSASTLRPPVIITLSLAGGIGVGLLATANIQYSLFFLHLALIRLAEGKAVEKQQAPWPLSPLFHVLKRINQRIDAAFQQEQLNDEYREQLLRQAREVAATEERSRIARDLHDSIKQQLFSIRMSTQVAQARMQEDVAEAQEALADIQKSANEAQVEMQALLQQLRSLALEHTNLTEAVQTQAQALTYRSGAQVFVKMTDLPAADRCPLLTQEAIFRIVQEAFHNIARHARAQNVWCTFTQQKNALIVVIQDDGQGFDMEHAPKGMGLANIQERAHHLEGTATIESAPGKGTTIQVTIPLLLPQAMKQQQELQELEVQKMEERAQGWLHLRSTMAVFVIVAMFVTPGLAAMYSKTVVTDAVILSAAFCLPVMLYGLISAHLAIARIATFRGEADQETSSLRLLEYGGRLGFSRLLLIALWNVLLWRSSIFSHVAGWIMGLLFIAVEGLGMIYILVEHRRCERAQNHYYTMVTRSHLAWLVRRQSRQILWRTLLILCLGLFLLAYRRVLSFPPVAFWQWLIYDGFLLLLIICASTLIDVWQLRPWRQMVTEKTVAHAAP